MLFREHGLAIELDSDKYHGTPWRRRQGAKRRGAVRGGGTEVLALTDDDATPEREAQTAAKVWAALQRAERGGVT